jgi:uncharacterized protein
MNRIEKLRQIVDSIILENSNADERRSGFIHLYGVAQACDLLARRRGLNQEIAIMAGMLHDIYRYKYEYQDHAPKGAILAREVLDNLKKTYDVYDDEIDIICIAIKNHSNKSLVEGEYDELLKDADVFQHCTYNPLLPIEETERKRFEKLLEEFGLVRVDT